MYCMAPIITEIWCIFDAGGPLSMGSVAGRRNQAKARLLRRRRAVRVDEVCRYLFPMLFILFNAWYWYYYREERALYIDRKGHVSLERFRYSRV